MGLAMQESVTDIRWMHHAIRLGQRGLGTTQENPSVGCVLVKDGHAIGTGTTQPGGRPHAEVAAIAQARQVFGADATHGATAYVSLEPCAHTGKTAPCAQALIEAGLVRVVCPLLDPDPRVAGKGFAVLQDAGIAITKGVLAELAEEAHRGFLSRIRRKRPFVTLKLASTLDGKIATSTGDSRWITGKSARQRVHLERYRHDAVMIGAGTMRADDPVLNVRLGGLQAPRLRVVIDPNLSISSETKLLNTPSYGDVRIYCRVGQEKALPNAQISPVKGQNFDLTQVLEDLASYGINTVFCEGGGTLAAHMLKQNLVDQFMLFQGNCVIGDDGRDVMGGLNIQALIDAPQFKRVSTEYIGNDSLSILQRV